MRHAAPFIFFMTNEEKTQRYRVLVEECLKAQRFEEAIAFYRQLIDLNPGDDSYRLGLAWAFHDCGKADQAVACFEQVFEKELRRRIFTGFAFDELVRIYKERKKYDRLVDVCERAMAAQPEDIALLGELGDAYLNAGRAGDAVSIFEKMTTMEPDASSFFCSLGQACIMNHDYVGGEAAYRRAAAIDPADAGSFFDRMAQSFLQANQMEKAEKAFRNGLSEHNDAPMLLLGLGDVLIQQGKLKEGSAVYQRAVELSRDAAGVYLNRLGHTLARAHYYLEAIGAFKKAIAHDPQNPFYYMALSESYQSLGNLEMAAETLHQAQRIHE
ncbi:MAG: tetratricopeptide repeat protein [Pseudomonadota bacterium]